MEAVRAISVGIIFVLITPAVPAPRVMASFIIRNSKPLRFAPVEAAVSAI